jgi:GNAT superfamily N-acetyltransferase
MDVRDADASELDALTTIWYEGWRDAHLHIVPPTLTLVRTRASFRQRLNAALASVRVTGPVGAPVGFHLIKGDELYQLYVAEESRGTGVAGALIADAEERLAASGVTTAWLACAIGNERAARFYEKRGWQRTGTVTSLLETPIGGFPLDVWRYEKLLSTPAGSGQRS